MAERIRKANNAEADEFEQRVGTEINNLQTAATDELRTELRDLYLVSAREVATPGSGRPSVVLFAPYRLMGQFRRIQQRFVRELEKRFTGRSFEFHVSSCKWFRSR